MTWREITAMELNCLKQPLVIDVRSPCEHAPEHIIDSINIALLSNEEREMIGTVYAQQGELVARRQAVNIIAPKVPEIIQSICNLRKAGQTVVIHCWRGGLRSEAVASMLGMAGIECFRLTGGYKAWRRQVLADFENDAYKFTAVVLHGLTGTGKTDILNQLTGLGRAVLDLEKIANHRGSVFGGMGLGKQPTQKNFESQLWQQLRMLPPQPVFVEAESRKLGKLSLPDCVFKRIQSGLPVLVTGSMTRRVERIVNEYARVLDEDSRQQAVSSLNCLKARIGASCLQEVQEMLMQGQLHEAVKILLCQYYDPLYSGQIENARPFALEVSGDDYQAGAKAIHNWALNCNAQ